MAFVGTYTALVTPFQDDQVDMEAFERLIERQAEAGVDGIVAVGTTGESPTLSYDEHAEVIRKAVAFSNGRVKVLAGTGSNSTREAIALTREAEAAGADAALVVAPYYNKPSQEGLYRHYRAIAESTSLPIMLYSIPGRCGIEIGIGTTVRLAADCPNIVAIKEAGGSVERVSLLRRELPPHFDVLCGDDALTLPFMSVGAVGVVSVASNILPCEVRSLVEAARSGDFATAQAIHGRLHPLFNVLFIEPNPVPAKVALAYLGRMRPDVRSPLCEMLPAHRERLLEVLKGLGLEGAL
ncbi:MAG: 4-hydroxy-tetrahydrodipicolinate synthase [Verrucomicrobiia bacterium]